MSGAAEQLLKSQPQLYQFMIMDYPASYSARSHKNVYNELVYILDGRMTLFLEKNQQFQAGPGDLLLIPSETEHRDEFTKNTGLRVLFITFTWDEPEFFQRVTNRILMKLDYDIRSEVQRRLEFMRSHYDSSPENSSYQCFQLHGILMLLYYGAVKSGAVNITEENSIHERMIRAYNYILRNYSKTFSQGDVAGFIGMNPSYFSKQFAHEFGVKFSDFLTAIRLEQAKFLLLDSARQVSEIAAMCGFSSSGYFIKVFRRHFGQTPQAYRALEQHRIKSNTIALQ